RPDVALHAPPAGARPLRASLASRDLVDLVDEDDSALFDALDRDSPDAVHVDELALFLLDEIVERLGHLHAPLPRPTLNDAGEHVLDVDVDLFNRRSRDELERRKSALAHLEIDRSQIEPPVPELLAEFLARLMPRLLCGEIRHVLDMARRHR